MESFFSTLRTERTASKVYRTRDEARADVFDYVQRFYNPRRRPSKLGYISTNEVRSPRYASLTNFPQNRQQLTLVGAILQIGLSFYCAASQPKSA